MQKKLTKSRDGRVVAGVFSGLAKYFNIDVTILRIIYVIILVSGFGSPIVLYLILALIIPSEGYTSGYQRQNTYYQANQPQEKKDVTPTAKDSTDEWGDF